MLPTHLRVLAIAAVCLVIPFTHNAQQPTPDPSKAPTDTGGAPLDSNYRHAPLGDYVPCLFNHDEVIAMHALVPKPRTPAKIDDSTAIELYSATTTAISKFSSQPNYDPKEVQNFLDEYTRVLSAAELVGNTPSEAYSKIMQALQGAKAKLDQTQAQPSKTASYGLLSPNLQDINTAAGVVATAVNNAAQQVKQKSKATTVDATMADQFINATGEAIDNFKSQANYDPRVVQDFLNSYQQFLGGKSNLIDRSPDSALKVISNATDGARNYLVRQRELIGVPHAATSAAPGLSPQDIASAVSAVLDHVKEAATDVIEGKTPQPFQAPNDVSCSVSLLSWKEASDTFGRRVANTFVAIQVTVRNLNAKNEFLIHDIQVAIDTGIYDSEFGRFQAGRDKLLVRAVAQRGQSDDRRNLILHSLETVGAIAGSSSIAGSSDFKTAVAVFQGAFIPGFSNIWPDHTVEQLNHINDLVFSASSTSKVLVPIQGSVPLVTFIAEKPVEQLPFAWCGYNSKGRFHGRLQYCELDETKAYRVDHGREVTSMKRGKQSGTADKRSPADNGSSADPNQYAQFWDDLHYSEWKARALEILQRRTFVVIGGVHIQEVKPAAKISNLDCPTLNSGPADLSQVKDGLYTCTATGENLGLVSSVKLEKGSDKIAGKIKPAKDGNSADVTFDPAALSDYSGVFALYLLDQAGTETNSGESVLLSTEAVVSKVEESTLDISQASATLTVDGKHLDQLNDVSLVPDETAGSAVKGVLQSPSGTTAKVSFTSSSLTGGKQYHLAYTIKADPFKQIDVKTITVKTSAAAPSAGGTPQKPAARPGTKGTKPSTPAGAPTP